MANYTSSVKQYMNKVMANVLPKSDIERYDLNKIGLYYVKPTDYIKLPDELADSRHMYRHEKCTPTRYLLKSHTKEDAYSPIYFRFFNDGPMLSGLGKIIANNALQFYSTPLNTYGMITESASSSSIGVATIDLNHLQNPNTGKGVESTRLDHLLSSLGLPFEINSFKDFQNLLEQDAVLENFTPRALVQLGLSTIFIPNAIGETDANSRNVILLKDKDDKWDTVVRIDAEANTYLNDLERSRSGNKAVPKGIYSANENQDEFLKTIQSKDVGIDWDLFTGFTLLAKEATSRTSIDNAITKAYMINSQKLDTSSPFFRQTPLTHAYGAEAFYDFSEKTIDRASRFTDNVLTALGNVHTSTLPFAEPNSKYPELYISDDKLDPLVQQQFTSNYTPIELTPEA